MSTPSALRVGIVGATGYSGLELVRILERHPQVKITVVTAESNAGQQAVDVYPSLLHFLSLPLIKFDAQELRKQCDLVFVALPGGLSSTLVPQLVDEGLAVIDLGGDFRLPAAVYEEWYKKPAPPAEVQQQAVYGLAEWYADEVANARLVTNPGCYPTATLLGALPLVKHGLIDPRTLIVDAKSGVSGSGRGLSLFSHFSETNENFKAYKVGNHQHTPEIEMQLARVTGQPTPITFTTQIVPMTRGIMATIYGQLIHPITSNELHELFRAQYEGQPFVRIRPLGAFPATKEVAGSNFCDIGVHVDSRTGRVTAISVIDNLVKGAAGQAVQNLNIMMGWSAETALWHVPVYP